MWLEWRLDDGTNDLIAACIEGIDGFLEARGMNRRVLERIIAESAASDEIKAGFRLAEEDPEFFNTQAASEDLCRFALYCYLRAAFTYTEQGVVG
jgi:hypothetical protein